MRDMAAYFEPSAEDPTPSGRHRLASPGGGTRIGRWTVRRRLQRGGCADVFYAIDETTGVESALKIVQPGAPHLARLHDALRYEGELLSRIHHPHVVQLYERGELPDGTPYLALELARGHDLADRIDQHGPAPIPMVVEVGRQLLSAIAALTAAGVVHRDIKPENIMLEETDDGLRVKLIDLGIAVSTLDPWSDRARGQMGAFAGTPQYVSPEQAQALPVDQRADLYSLGVVLYEMLVGAPPCIGSTPYDTLVKVITAEPASIRLARPDCPSSLEGAVLQALAKRPESRFQSAASMARALGICARLGAMPEGAKAFEGAPRVPSNATRPFELQRPKSRENTPMCDPSYVLALEGRAPTPSAFPVAPAAAWGTPAEALPPPELRSSMIVPRPVEAPRRLEPTIAVALSRPPPRDRPAIFVEGEEAARWLWPLVIGMLLIALAGAVLGSGELDLRGDFWWRTAPAHRAVGQKSQ